MRSSEKDRRVRQSIKERDEALKSLDKDKIIAYCKKYSVRLPEDNENVFWAAVHKARLQILASTPEERAYSLEWLLGHGFSADI